MTTVVLRLEHTPALRVDVRDLDAGLAATSPSDIARVRVRHGNDSVELGSFFRVEVGGNGEATPELRFEGDLGRFDRIGWRLAGGRIIVDGDAGDYCGGLMTGGDIVVKGNARDCTGCAMAGGQLVVHGDVGDFAVSALPGDMEGMRGGSFLVRGSAGARLGDRMRRGLALVFGDVGGFVGSRMVAGTIAVGGVVGEHAGYGMRRGSIVCARPKVAPDLTFLPIGAEAGVIWQLLARDLQAHGGPFAGLATRRPMRFVGDVAVNGTGEILIAS